jgi:hypothetical protein
MPCNSGRIHSRVKIAFALIVTFVLIAWANPASAEGQCVMCKAVAEDSARRRRPGGRTEQRDLVPDGGAIHFVVRPFLRNL